MDGDCPLVKKQKTEGGYTYMKKHRILYNWMLNDMSVRLKPTGNKCLVLNSSQFTTGSKIKDQWRVIFHFNNGVAPKYPAECLTVFLENLNIINVAAEFSFFILNSNQEKINFSNSVKVFAISQKIWGIHTFVKKQVLLTNKSELMPNDILTVCTEVIVIENETAIPPKVSSDPSKMQLVLDLKELYYSKKNSDVTIVIEDKKFQAHKIILMARSPVLAAMFTHDMAERKSNEVTIVDITPETFEKLLQYVYTDEVSNLDVVAADLLEAANKYQLESLKKMCEESLCRILNRENVVQMMTFADRHNAVNLLKYSTECIAVDAENVIHNNDFKEIEKSSLGFKLFKTLMALHANNGTEIIYSS